MKISSLKLLKYGCMGISLYFATQIVICSAIWDMRDIVTEEAMLSNQITSFLMIIAFSVIEMMIVKQIKKKKAKDEEIEDLNVFHES